MSRCRHQVRGSDGRKMSKSLGNVIDPCDLMEGRALPDLLARLKASNLDPKQQALSVPPPPSPHTNIMPHIHAHY